MSSKVSFDLRSSNDGVVYNNYPEKMFLAKVPLFATHGLFNITFGYVASNACARLSVLCVTVVYMHI